MAIGDFNAILSSDDKKGGHAKGRRCRFFGNFMDSTLLHDLGFQIPSFTWHRGFPSERLDRAVGNDAWVEAFPNCLITHLPRIKLDHRPLLMKFCYTDTCVPNRPFRFLAGWLHHQNFPEFVKHNWRFNGNLVSTMEELTNKLQEWNKGVYGHITHRKRKLLHKLARIQHALDFSGSNSLSQQEALVRDELEDILHHEEILWKQKSRYPSRSLPSNVFLRLSFEDVASLGKGVTNEEIKSALFDMAPWKALGSDGFQAGFFQNQWDILGEAICEWVKKVFEEGTIDPEFNNTLIVLILKVKTPENFAQFRPISLCSVLYKLVMKIIANRFKSIFPKIIGQEQAGFIAGRSIIDNVIIRVTNGMLNFLVERVHRQLSSWDAKQLSFAGRVTLAHSVLLAIPSYIMQSTLVPKGICDSIEKLVRQFIWGAMEGGKKLALVGWNNICQPKIHGGLGLRRLEDQNKAFLLKIGYSLITKIEALWVQVLRAKYGFHEVLPVSIMRSRCSYMWKVVAKTWLLLYKNIIWSIGNGRSVRCWEDNWVPTVGPLNQYVLDQGIIISQSKVNEMVLDNGVWNIDLFRSWLPEDVVNRIISIPPPSESTGPDTLSCARTTSGVFSVKSVYFMLRKDSWNSKDANWNFVWKIPGPQRVRQFICWANHFFSTFKVVTEHRPNQSTTSQNSSMCFYLNTDGATHSVSGFSAVGGVIYDGKG
ncbi:uncharacterized protein [Gossypium hirsutum]|uniref:Reverse transcriptase n=1 Tax=Gossypium hirsutum TaxID=3635 RepID=A0A1U8IIR9_GOSHI|nr:uncharacterized protein LOC107895513 [Gossypium hirsutum]